MEGLEPTRISTTAPKAVASTISPHQYKWYRMTGSNYRPSGDQAIPLE